MTHNIGAIINDIYDYIHSYIFVNLFISFYKYSSITIYYHLFNYCLDGATNIESIFIQKAK